MPNGLVGSSPILGTNIPEKRRRKTSFFRLYSVDLILCRAGKRSATAIARWRCAYRAYEGYKKRRLLGAFWMSSLDYFLSLCSRVFNLRQAVAGTG